MIKRLAGGILALTGLAMCLPSIHTRMTYQLLILFVDEKNHTYTFPGPFSPFGARATVVSIQIALIALGGYLLVNSAPGYIPVDQRDDTRSS